MSTTAESARIERERAESITHIYVVEQIIRGQFEYIGRFETKAQAERVAEQYRDIRPGRTRVVTIVR